MRRNFIASNPNNSKPIKSDAIGAFVTPQNTDTMPTAAQRDGEIPKSVPQRQPNVAPIVKEGTISPPLNPAPSVMAVKIIFQKKDNFGTSPWKASSMRLTPAPLYALVFKINVKEKLNI